MYYDEPEPFHDTYTELMMDEWEGCTKEQLDEGCEDCGGWPNHCPLTRRKV